LWRRCVSQRRARARAGSRHLSLPRPPPLPPQPLTVTGSIGVVTGKFSLEKLYARVGYAKTLISKGRYAEILAESRPQTPDEAALFDAAATSAYESFRDRAAASRGMPVDALEAVAQGRVWTGRAALAVGLVDSLGGTAHAVRVAARLAGVPDSERVAVLELSRSRASPLALVTGGASALTRAALAFASMASAGGPEALARGLGAAAAALAGGSDLAAAASNPGAVQCLAPDVQVVGASELGRWP
jgi:protease-4